MEKEERLEQVTFERKQAETTLEKSNETFTKLQSQLNLLQERFEFCNQYHGQVQTNVDNFLQSRSAIVQDEVEEFDYKDNYDDWFLNKNLF